MIDRCCRVYEKVKRKIFPCLLIVYMILSVSCSSMTGSETKVANENVVSSPIEEPQNNSVPAEKEYETVLPEPEGEQSSEESKTEAVEYVIEEIKSSPDTEETNSETGPWIPVEFSEEPEVGEQPEDEIDYQEESTEDIPVSEPFTEPVETVSVAVQNVTEAFELTQEAEVEEVTVADTQPYEFQI